MYWFDGHLHQGTTLAITCDEPALLYGATVFTTLRVYSSALDHPLTLWQAHCDRLRHTLDHFSWPHPPWTSLHQGAVTMAQHYPVLRITCWPDGRELITGRPLPQELAKRQQQGVSAWLAESANYHRPLANFKTGNYLGGWLALQAAQRQQCQEAILINERREWLETATGNLWGWYQEQWWTPPLAAGILPGTMRHFLDRHLQQQGIALQTAPWSPELVQQFETLAYSNAVVQLIPIHTVITEASRLEYNSADNALATLKGAFVEV
jgi:4-amino-4-deoxychorismate lyase